MRRVLALLAMAALCFGPSGVARATGVPGRVFAVSGGTYVPGDHGGPSNVVLPLGSTLTFQNLDIKSTHTVTATLPGPDGLPLFDSAEVSAGDSGDVARISSLGPGEYRFVCILHDWMSGTLQIVDV